MTSAAIVAFGAVSAMGEGSDAVSSGRPGERARVCITRDAELAAAGLARPYAARAALHRPPAAPDDRASALLLVAALACARELDTALPSWRELRVGLALGTSSGGMRTAERFFDAPDSRELAGDATYFAPMLHVVAALGLAFEPATLVLGACAASTLALGVSTRWLEADACDVVLAGGFDAVSVFVASGFEALRATTASIPPRPFRLDRDGMSLGEGAAVLALRSSHLARGARVHITGFGASADGVHLTAPDRSGSGLAAAASAARREAGDPGVDLVSPHGSATPFSDAAESRAIATALRQEPGRVVLHPFKAQVGHTLGASGALELLASADALTRGVYPAAAGDGANDPDAPAMLLDTARAGAPRTALKLSAAFGGANAALVVSLDSRPPRVSPMRAVYVRRPVYVGDVDQPDHEIVELCGEMRLARATGLARLALVAVGELVRRDGPVSLAGVVVGTPFATLDTNAAFHARIRERGARMAEPRRFPYTSPNAASGEVGVAFGLKGPSFAVGCGPSAGLEAVAAAATLVAAGDADAMVVAAVDAVGAASRRAADAIGVDARTGAVALVVTCSPEGAIARVVSSRCGLGASNAGAPPLVGHTALMPLLDDPLPRVLAAGSLDPRGGGWARLDLAPLD